MSRDHGETLEALRRSEERLELLMAQVPAILWSVDRELRFTYSNGVGLQGTGQLPGEIVGTTLYELVRTESEQHVAIAAARRALRGETVSYVDSLDGLTFDTTVRPLRDDQGSIVGVVGLSMDVTQRCKAADTLRKQGLALEQSIDGIAITDPGGHLLFVNSSLAEMHGSHREDLVGKHLSIFHTEAQLANELLPFLARVRLKRGCEAEIGHVRVDGQEFPTWTSASAVEDEAGEGIGLVLIVRDIRQQRETEEQLREAQKLEAVGTLAVGAAQDFDQLVSTIMGLTQLALVEAPESGSLRSSLEAALDAATRARALAAQILAFGRKGERERTVTRLQPVLWHALRQLRSRLPEEIELRQRIDEDAPPLLADAGQLRGVVLNLCSNALEAMTSCAGVLRVDFSSVEVPVGGLAGAADLRPGPHLRLAVSDTGPGMGPAVVERIFEPYFTTRVPSEGRGLGLAVAHGVVARHGGAIRVDTAPGEGTTVELFLPAAPGSTTPARARSAKPAAARPARILVVDDEAPLVALLQRTLERQGYGVTGTTSGLEALELLRSSAEHFDLLICDVVMPRMPGDALAASARELLPDLPILLITGFSGTLSQEEARAAGATRLLHKPIPKSELVAVVRRALEGELDTDEVPGAS